MLIAGQLFLVTGFIELYLIRSKFYDAFSFGLQQIVGNFTLSAVFFLSATSEALGRDENPG